MQCDKRRSVRFLLREELLDVREFRLNGVEGALGHPVLKTDSLVALGYWDRMLIRGPVQGPADEVIVLAQGVNEFPEQSLTRQHPGECHAVPQRSSSHLASQQLRGGTYYGLRPDRATFAG